MYPTLDKIVLETLDLYKNKGILEKINLSIFQTPLVVWSGNAFYTGRILFRNLWAYFGTEAEVEKKLQNIDTITDVVILSASWEKHAPIIVNTAKKYNKKTFLISSSQKSSARNIVDESIIMPKIREPYTYNTSTYFGYMLTEDPTLDLSRLEEFIHREIDKELSKVDFSKYKNFFIVIPDEFVLLREMLEVKFIELFGRKVARDVFSYEQMKHATTVVEDEDELFICFGNSKNTTYGKNQIDLPIFDNTSYAAMMLVGYYVIGKIQTVLPPYFIESIDAYCEKAKIQSGFTISPWVEV